MLLVADRQTKLAAQPGTAGRRRRSAERTGSLAMDMLFHLPRDGGVEITTDRPSRRPAERVSARSRCASGRGRARADGGRDQPAFRALCRGFGAGLYVSEMILARGVVDGHRKTRRLAEFHADESPRSLQLYGSDPGYLGEATRLLVGEGAVDHLDLNFGCPVRKVTGQRRRRRDPAEAAPDGELWSAPS
jgi:hypothetical protein